MVLEKDLNSQLERLGLNKNEAAVYIDLLGRELTNVGPIVQATKLHRQQVYEALARLQDYGLVTEVNRQGRKHFQAAKPQRLMLMAEEQVRIAESLVPKLNALEKIGIDRIEVRVLYGSQGYFENLLEMIEDTSRNGSELKVMGGAPEAIFYHALGQQLFDKYLKAMQKKKVGIKMVSPSWYSKTIKDDFVKFPRHELRVIESGLSSPTFTRISPEMTAIEIFSPEVMILSIRSRAVARTYLEHFERLWAEAAPYKLRQV